MNKSTFLKLISIIILILFVVFLSWMYIDNPKSDIIVTSFADSQIVSFMDSGTLSYEYLPLHLPPSLNSDIIKKLDKSQLIITNNDDLINNLENVSNDQVLVTTQDGLNILSPKDGQEITDLIEQKISKVDLENSQKYAQKSQELISTLSQIDTDYDSLDQCQLNSINTLDDSLDFLSQYNLTVNIIPGYSSDFEPGIDTAIKTINNLVQTEQRYLVYSSQNPSQNLLSIAQEAGVTMLPFDSLERPLDDADIDYTTRLKNNLDSLKQALQCS